MTKLNFDVPDMDERGVSPVIGVILMVAITVILAAVIASFVLGFGGSVNENVQAGASVDANDNIATVTWVSEGSADSLVVNATDGDGDSVEVPIGNVGGTATINGSDDSGLNETGGADNVRIVVTGVSGDTSTVVSQETVNLSA